MHSVNRNESFVMDDTLVDDLTRSRGASLVVEGVHRNREATSVGAAAGPQQQQIHLGETTPQDSSFRREAKERQEEIKMIS